MRSSQNVLGILRHRRFGTPWGHTVWTECYWSFLRARFAEEEARQVADRDSGLCITITHRATHRLLCSNFCHHSTTVLSGSRSEWLLAVRYSENGPQGGSFVTMEDIKSDATAELPNIRKETSAGAFSNGRTDGASVRVRVRVRVCVCARAQECYFVSD
jgi:hypothetical protein